MAEAAVRERDPRQECGCPADLVECVHFDHLTLWLGDNSESGTGPAGPRHYSSKEWIVMGPAQPRACTHTDCPGHLVMRSGAANASSYDSLPAAQTDFARRAELLRLGGGDG